MGKKKKNDWSGSVFIRHTPKAKIFKKPGRIKELFEQNIIAIDFGNKKNKNPNKVKRKKHERTALETLQACHKKGAIVCAEYSYSEDGSKKATKMLVGKIIKNKTTIQPKKILNKLVNRTMKLESCLDPIPIDSPAYILMAAIRPRGGTIAKYSSRSSKLVKAIFSKKPLPLKVGSLIPAQLEIICYEYLKRKKKLDALLLPIGRTLQYVDIYGIDKKGKKYVFAQVTQSKDAQKIKDKIELLNKHKGDKSVLFFFGPKDKEPEHPGIKYIPVETVFKKFKKSDMIKAMLPRNYLKT